MSVHVKEDEIVEISAALHYGLPHNRGLVLASKTSDIIVKLSFHQACNRSIWSKGAGVKFPVAQYMH